jgi:hypothetical protein
MQGSPVFELMIKHFIFGILGTKVCPKEEPRGLFIFACICSHVRTGEPLNDCSWDFVPVCFIKISKLL